MKEIEKRYFRILCIFLGLISLAMLMIMTTEISRVSKSDQETIGEIVVHKHKDEMEKLVSHFAKSIGSENDETCRDIIQKMQYIEKTIDSSEQDLDITKILYLVRHVNAQQLGTPIKLLVINEDGTGKLYDHSQVNAIELTAVEIEELAKKFQHPVYLTKKGKRCVLFSLQEDIDIIVKEKIHRLAYSFVSDGNYICIDQLFDKNGGTCFAKRLTNPLNISEEECCMSSYELDARGNQPYEDMLTGIREDGCCFYKYYTKDEVGELGRLCYSYYYEPYDWIISTSKTLDSIYENTEKIEEQRWEALAESYLFSFALISIVVLAGFIWIVYSQKKYNTQIGQYVQTEKERIQEEQLERLRLALDSAESANKAKNSFLFNMSHDLRTPINAILGFAQLSEQNIEDKDYIFHAIQKIKTSSNILLVLINDVLELAKIEGKNIKTNYEVQDIHELIVSMQAMFELSMKENQICFEIKEDIKDSFVICDLQRMNQVTMNLLSNAVKFTPKGGTVQLALLQMEHDRDGYGRYKISVTDTGIGMSSDFKERMFNQFERERTSTVSKKPGTGLGLTIVKSIVDVLGGEIHVESQVGKGTTIEIDLEFQLAEQQKFDEVKQVEGIRNRYEGKRILMVEDNELNREIGFDVLSANGFYVDQAVDGSEAVDKIKNAKVGDYDLVLMDIQMPIMDGYTATKNIRKLENCPLAQIPIIAMTANAFDEDRERAMNSGMNDFIEKPVDVSKLFIAMSRLLED